MNEVTTQKAAPIVAFKQNLSRLIDAGELALPSNVSVDAFRNAAIVAAQDNPKIMLCTNESVFKSIRRLAAAGLVPDGREAALVPFKTKNPEGQVYIDVCQAMPMVLGLIKVARNSGEVADIRAHIVYQSEVDSGRFVYLAGDDEKLTHDPILFGEKGEAVGAYAIATMKDGSVIREVMDASRIDRARKSGASQLDFQSGQKPTVSARPKGIWADWWEDMWKKTVIRAMIKRMPISAEDMRRIADLDEARHEMKDVTPTPDATQQPRKTLAQRIAEKAEDQPSDVGQQITGEIMDDGHWTDRVDLSEAFPGDDAFTEGAQAAEDTAKGLRDCPYAEGSEKAVHWLGGFSGKRGAMA